MSSSPSRTAAARANGAKSSGPKTSPGKLHSSRNAITHGLSARTVVIHHESEQAYESDLRAYLDHFRPNGKPETDLVHQLAAAQWRLARYAGVESGLLDQKMDDQAQWLEDKYEHISDRHRLSTAFESLSGPNAALALLNRYQARLQNEYRRLLKTLVEVQAARHARELKLPNEPKPDAGTPAPSLAATGPGTLCSPSPFDGDCPQQSAGDVISTPAETHV